jgi:hypothetical protein
MCNPQGVGIAMGRQTTAKMPWTISQSSLKPGTIAIK